MKLEETCIVVTGAAGGIGAALARRFVAGGARAVVIADVQDGALRTTAAAIGATRSSLRRDRRAVDRRAG